METTSWSQKLSDTFRIHISPKIFEKTKMENAVQIDAQNAPQGSKCTCQNPSFEKKQTWPILGNIQCNHCGKANVDHFYVCKTCGLRFCEGSMDYLKYSR